MLTQRVTDLSALTVTLTGTEWARTEWGANTYSDHREFFTHVIPITTFDGDSWLERGQYAWPFSVVLPQNIPSTMAVGYITTGPCVSILEYFVFFTGVFVRLF